MATLFVPCVNDRDTYGRATRDPGYYPEVTSTGQCTGRIISRKDGKTLHYSREKRRWVHITDGD
jgi:hypothetical protein